MVWHSAARKMQYVFPVHFINDDQTHFLTISKDRVAFWSGTESRPFVAADRYDLAHSISYEGVVFKFGQKQVRFVTSFARSLRNFLYFNVSAPIQYGCLIGDAVASFVLSADYFLILKDNKQIVRTSYALAKLYVENQFVCIYNNTETNTSLLARLEFSTNALAREIKDFCAFYAAGVAQNDVYSAYPSMAAIMYHTASPPVSGAQQSHESSYSRIVAESQRLETEIYSNYRFTQKCASVISSEPQDTQIYEKITLSSRDSQLSVEQSFARADAKTSTEAITYFNQRYTFLTTDGAEIWIYFSFYYEQLLALLYYARNYAIVRGIRAVDIIENVCVLAFTLNDLDLLLLCKKQYAQQLMRYYKVLPLKYRAQVPQPTRISVEDARDALNSQYEAIDQRNEATTLLLRCAGNSVSLLYPEGCVQKGPAVYQISFLRENASFQRLYIRTEERMDLLWLPLYQAYLLLSAWVSLNSAYNR